MGASQCWSQQLCSIACHDSASVVAINSQLEGFTDHLPSSSAFTVVAVMTGLVTLFGHHLFSTASELVHVLGGCSVGRKSQIKQDIWLALLAIAESITGNQEKQEQTNREPRTDLEKLSSVSHPAPLVGIKMLLAAACSFGRTNNYGPLHRCDAVRCDAVGKATIVQLD